jgi:hypothetical protein
MPSSENESIKAATSAHIESFAKSNEELVYIDGSIFWDGRTYVLQLGQIIATGISGIVGITTYGQTVYSLGELPTEQWLGMLRNGITIVFKEISQPYLSLNEFHPSQIIVRDTSTNQTYATISKPDVLRNIISDLSDENLVAMPEGSLLTFVAEMFSDKYPGISFIYMLLHDSDGNCFVFDYANSEVWIVGHDLIGAIPPEYLDMGEQHDSEKTSQTHLH